MIKRVIYRRCACGAKVEQGKACQCKAEARKELGKSLYDSTFWRGSGARQGLREMYLGEHPLCVICRSKGFVVSATVVDHIEPHRGDWNLFSDWDNLQALCDRCHGRKSSSERVTGY